MNEGRKKREKRDKRNEWKMKQKSEGNWKSKKDMYYELLFHFICSLIVYK